MAQKTFKPGEVAHGGLIRVTTTKTKITVTFLDWNTKEYVTGSTFATENSRGAVEMFVADNATVYWADQVCEWLDTKVPDSKAFRHAGSSFSIF